MKRKPPASFMHAQIDAYWFMSMHGTDRIEHAQTFILESILDVAVSEKEPSAETYAGYSLGILHLRPHR